MTTVEPSDNEPSHYFDPSPSVVPTPISFDVSGPWGSLQMVAESGVFSGGGLDKGTEVLLRTVVRMSLPSPAPGALACDMGCGSGVLACVLAASHPDWTVHAVDVNERARDLTRRNAETNRLGNVNVLHGLAPPADARYHVIWSNPPIRIGKEALHELLMLWLSHLHPDGYALLVVARHLGADSLVKWLTTEGFPVRRVSSSRGFRVIEVRPQAADIDDQ